MSFFQESIKKKYLNELDNEFLDNKYRQFLEYFNNKDIQQNIRNSKEEQFQEGFLRELFVNIFGYTLNPNPDYNLTTELKNTANNKKVDGAILKNGEAIAVIELKGTDTSDLDKVESQAFGYKNHNPKCIYVITSNFEKIRFYIQNAVENLNFNLFNITREQFALMWLCLAKDNLLNDIPLKMKESSLMQEENITKKLYADYSKFRTAIYTNLVKNNIDNNCRELKLSVAENTSNKGLQPFANSDTSRELEHSVAENTSNKGLQPFANSDTSRELEHSVAENTSNKGLQPFANSDTSRELKLSVAENTSNKGLQPFANSDTSRELKLSVAESNKEHRTIHITWVTHNSRITERMIRTHAKTGEPVWLTNEMRRLVYKALVEKINEMKLRVLALNVLCDHVHLLLVCNPLELVEIIRKLKGYSSFYVCRELKFSDVGDGRKNKFWASSYSDTFINNEQHLNETINYIESNHIKHGVEDCRELKHSVAENTSNKGLQPFANSDTSRELKLSVADDGSSDSSNKELQLLAESNKELQPFAHIDKLLLFKKTQKLLDRFLFVFFAEDRLLIPPNSIREIINQWKVLKDELDEYMPLYARFKKFFGYLNTGYKGKNYEIFAYNGGLFAPDEILDNITLDDNILFEHTSKLSQYDFDTEVDVNILGHIFEHSLGEIESVQAEIQNEVNGRELKHSVADDTSNKELQLLAESDRNNKELQLLAESDRNNKELQLLAESDRNNKELQLLAHSNLAQTNKTSKRKKDGIFYTPKYITKYIVENTVGKLCIEKRAEFGIIDEEYAKGRKNRKHEELLELDKNLTDYRNWLLNITILDPACGSGAFLNQALDFLINEHQKIDNLRASLLEEGLVFADITSDILENNIYGVDINEESVEIAKLSLWLRTAQIGRKLNSLSNNIKCGNSLIDDPTVAGDKAFNWEKEFPQVFGAWDSGLDDGDLENNTKPQIHSPNPKKGFDVVIGNPPYVVSRNFEDNEKQYYYDNYISSLYQINLYLLFIEKSIKLINPNGLVSLIVPNTWLINLTLKDFRKYLLENINIVEVVDLTKTNVFEDAVVLPIIFIINKNSSIAIEIKEYNLNSFITRNQINFSDINQNNNYLINYQSSNKDSSIINKIENLVSLRVDFFANVSFGVKFYQVNKGKPKQTREIVDKQIFTHREKVNSYCMMMLEGKDVDRYSLNWGGYWIEYGDWLAEPRNLDLFQGERILLRRIVNGKFSAMFINDSYCNNSLLHTIKFKNECRIYPKFVLTILNSKIYGFYFIRKYSRDEKTFPEIRVTELKELPIPNISPEAQQPFIALADKMLELNKELKEKENKFIELLKADFNIEKPSTKLENWTKLNWADFEKELNKLKIKLSGEKKEDWFERFNRFKSQSTELQNIISSTDKQIDKLVYELYELTEEEIRIVEGE